MKQQGVFAGIELTAGRSSRKENSVPIIKSHACQMFSDVDLLRLYCEKNRFRSMCAGCSFLPVNGPEVSMYQKGRNDGDEYKKEKCPFCGRGAYYLSHGEEGVDLGGCHLIACENFDCGATIKFQMSAVSKDELLNMWNRREQDGQ